jgi:hypothetical protein
MGVCILGEVAIESQIDEKTFIERKSSFISFRNYFLLVPVSLIPVSNRSCSSVATH